MCSACWCFLPGHIVKKILEWQKWLFVQYCLVSKVVPLKIKIEVETKQKFTKCLAKTYAGQISGTLPLQTLLAQILWEHLISPDLAWHGSLTNSASLSGHVPWHSVPSFWIVPWEQKPFPKENVLKLFYTWLIRSYLPVLSLEQFRDRTQQNLS